MLLLFFFSDTPAVSTPRRSPRLVQNRLDIFVHKLEEGTGKISNTAKVIHNVDRSAKLSKIIESLLKIGNEDALYVPRKGIYWLRKCGCFKVTLPRRVSRLNKNVVYSQVANEECRLPEITIWVMKNENKQT